MSDTGTNPDVIETAGDATYRVTANELRQFVERIERLATSQNILRVKGYAAVAGKPMRLLVQGVGARVRHQFDRPWMPGEARQGTLVVIAEHDDINLDAIRAVLVPEEVAAE